MSVATLVRPGECPNFILSWRWLVRTRCSQLRREVGPLTPQRDRFVVLRSQKPNKRLRAYVLKTAGDERSAPRYHPAASRAAVISSRSFQFWIAVFDFRPRSLPISPGAFTHEARQLGNELGKESFKITKSGCPLDSGSTRSSVRAARGTKLLRLSRLRANPSSPRAERDHKI